MDRYLIFDQPSQGQVIACTRTGASHIREGKPCQDAHAVLTHSVQGRPCVIVAAADGHGDPRHDRSGIGAEIAVVVAVRELAELATNYTPSSLNNLSSTFKMHIPRRVSSQWRESVRRHAAEWMGIPEGQATAKTDTVDIIRYGTTLATALVTPEMMLMAQIGDGAAVLVSTDGEVEFALEPDQKSIGSETSSLCSEDAEKRWAVSVRYPKSRDLALFLCTDGLLNAFATRKDIQLFFSDFCKLLADHGFVRIAQEVPRWLDNFSAKGSGDDMTLIYCALSSNAQFHLASSTAETSSRGKETREHPGTSASGPEEHQPPVAEEISLKNSAGG